MAAAQRIPRLFTADEYLRIERDVSYKSEFVLDADQSRWNISSRQKSASSGRLPSSCSK